MEQSDQDKRYALGLGLFVLAARSGDAGGLRERCRPVLLRLGAALGDSVFLLVRAGFDALCLDRWEGPFPIRSFTGDIGGRVPLGVGQGAMAILAHLPEAEREEVIRHNVPRLAGSGGIDGVFLRTEIAKVRRVIQKAEPSGPHETLLVLDANIGQNAVQQVKAFDQSIQVTGLVLTKLDGTAKGGVLAAIARQCPKPVRFIGVGEGIDDLQPFSVNEFVEALLAEPENTTG